MKVPRSASNTRFSMMHYILMQSLAATATEHLLLYTILFPLKSKLVLFILLVNGTLVESLYIPIIMWNIISTALKCSSMKEVQKSFGILLQKANMLSGKILVKQSKDTFFCKTTAIRRASETLK